MIQDKESHKNTHKTKPALPHKADEFFTVTSKDKNSNSSLDHDVESMFPRFTLQHSVKNTPNYPLLSSLINKSVFYIFTIGISIYGMHGKLRVGATYMPPLWYSILCRRNPYYRQSLQLLLLCSWR